MSNLTKTLIYVGVAVALVGVKFATTPRSGTPELFSDEGEPFFTSFTDPDQASALEVIEWDESTAVAKPFRVQRKNGRWSIPSHHDYPADAKEQMAKAAGLVIGLTKSSVRSDDPAAHKDFGLLDPNDPTADPEGRGTLVSFLDGSDNAVAKLIIGKEVEGHADMRYVRYPDKKRSYVASISSVPDTRFADWIDTKLLDISTYDISEITVDSYSIDEQTGMRVPGELIDAKKNAESKWTLNGLSENEEIDETPLTDIASAVSGLKIVGVRPKPDGLTKDLTRDEGIQLSSSTVMNLQGHGFFVAQDGNLYANEGDLLVSSKKGVTYVLRFGEILYGEGDDVSAGSEDEASAEKTESEDEGMKANRYLMITAHFDEKLLDKPKGTPLPKEALDQRSTARDGLRTLMTAIDRYREKTSEWPTSLDQLTEGDEPLLEKIDADPWGNAPVLSLEGEGDDVQAVVKSLGADGTPGGTGADADVASNAFAAEDALKKLATDMEAFEKRATEGKELAKKMTARFAPWYYVIDDASFKKLRTTRADLVKAKEEDAADPDENG